jgi:hypothetical protein
MRLGSSTSREVPGDDPWMVRVALSRSTEPNAGSVDRFTAVDLDVDDETPGVYPLLHEHGLLSRTDRSNPWQVERRRIEARNDDEARRITAAVYDAAYGFLQLGLAPTTGEPTAIDAPEQLTVEIGSFAWSFAASSAPVEAWHVLHAAQRMLASAR